MFADGALLGAHVHHGIVLQYDVNVAIRDIDCVAEGEIAVGHIPACGEVGFVAGEEGVVNALLLHAVLVEVRDSNGFPLGVERHGALIGEVDDFLSVGVTCAAAVGLGVPFGEGKARAGEGVGSQILRHVVSEGLVAHGATRVAIAVELHGVGVGCHRRADDDILVGHGERCAIERTCAGRIAGEGIAGGGFAMVQREVHRVAIASVKHIIIFDACTVAGDTRSGIRGGRSSIGHGGDVIACRDAVGLCALPSIVGSIVEVGGVVGVGGCCGGIPATGESGTVVTGVGLALGECGRGIEAVGDADGLVRACPSDEAAVAVALAVDL